MAFAKAPKIARVPFEKEETVWKGGQNNRYSVVRDDKEEGKKFISTLRLTDGKATIGWEVVNLGRIGIKPVVIPTLKTEAAIQPEMENAFREFLRSIDLAALPSDVSRFVNALKKEAGIA